MRVLLVHDRLMVPGGSEKVLAALAAIWPHAPIAVTINGWKRRPPAEPTGLEGREIRSTFLDRIPILRDRSRAVLPLLPFAVEQISTAGFDVVVSSSHAVAKGVISGPHQLHVCYCHSPMRYAWDMQDTYLRGRGLDWGPLGLAVRWQLHRLRGWDVRSANGVDRFVANSAYVARRIAKCYRRRATVINPPVDLAGCPQGRPKEDVWVTASRLVPYKRVDLLVETFRAMPGRRLEVIGDGPEGPRIRARAGGAGNIAFLGRVPRDELMRRIARARGFAFAAEEDFGIAPVEALACGTPIAAFGRGGVRDSIQDGVNGMLFQEQTPAAVRAAVERVEAITWDPAALRASVERFATPVFASAMQGLVERSWKALQEGREVEEVP
jgi:glycosyltransferase involved in cell wall biosynthesis